MGRKGCKMLSTLDGLHSVAASTASAVLGVSAGGESTGVHIARFIRVHARMHMVHFKLLHTPVGSSDCS